MKKEESTTITSVTEKVATFFGGYRLRKYSKGQILLFHHDRPDYIYYIVSGRVKQYDITYRGDEIILNVFHAPAFFPMSLALNKTENPYTYAAETDIEIRQAPVDATVAFLHQNPDVVFDLLSRVYRGVDGLMSRMLHLMTSSAKARVMLEIANATKRYGTHVAAATYTLDIHEADLGARAGLSRETVSREMKKLAAGGLLSIRAGRITIHNMILFEDKLRRAL